MGMGRSLRAALAVGLLVVAGTAFAAPPDGADPQKRFIDAISDAAVPTPAKIEVHLIPIRRDNTTLSWENDRADSRVKVVSWMSEKTFQSYYSDPADRQPDQAAA